jgi:hypothetical protein
MPVSAVADGAVPGDDDRLLTRGAFAAATTFWRLFDATGEKELRRVGFTSLRKK